MIYNKYVFLNKLLVIYRRGD